jgi:hypothetical protein
MDDKLNLNAKKNEKENKNERVVSHTERETNGLRIRDEKKKHHDDTNINK